MGLIVQKFGGSSVADAARVRNVASIIIDTYKQGNDVVADVIDCARHTQRRKFFGWEDSVEGYVVDYLDIKHPFFVRAAADDVAAAKQTVATQFGEVQYLTYEGAATNEIGFITSALTQREFDAKIAESGISVSSVIRVTDY